jgi:hypothetical protein
MRRHTALLAGALALAVATAPQLGAQDTTQKSSPGEVMAMPNFGSLIASLNASDQALTKLRALPVVDSTTSIVLVDVEPLLATGDKAAYDQALETKTSDIAALRTGLGEFPAVVTKLESDPKALTTADVVALDVTPDGEVWVYYHRAM